MTTQRTAQPTGPLGDALARLPLVPRRHALATPLEQRVQRLTDLARQAADTENPTTATSVHNLAALLASDRGLPGLARVLCLNHAGFYLAHRPLTADLARLALEPLVNLAHLELRAGNGMPALAILDELTRAVADNDDATLGGLVVPLAGLTASSVDRGNVHEWLSDIRVFGGARALVRAGRWSDARLHLQQSTAPGDRLFEARQVAAVAMAIEGRTALARTLACNTPAEEPWEHAIAAALTAACTLLDGAPAAEQTETLLHAHSAVAPQDGSAVFDTRLALTVADLATAAGQLPDAARVYLTAVGRTIAAPEGYSARDLARHPLADGLPPQQRRQLAAIAADSGVGGPATLTTDHDDRITAALALAAAVIRSAGTGR
ncbi:hypothetical protein HUT16_27275 [Kitasatospora sp. NA04385]|uniref:hypothetical protein n=1 Tax=Kitasatospora sp. NA04385 TaxID=2742135 RepID=UPI0015919145|nr:hypothetical protein [Kitasatospora sp. NA04385]QKW22282.1 hypothetical protein HUT16_27275 [Kitasatospora sp. NA04385]